MKNSKSCLMMIAILCVSGCSYTGPILKHYDVSLDSNSESIVTILPFIDHRKDKSILISEAHKWHWPEEANRSWLFAAVAEGLLEKRKGFNVRVTSDIGNISEVTGDDLADKNPTWVMKLGPEGSKYTLLMVLDDLASRGTFGVTVFAECSGYLFNKTTGKVVYSKESVGEYNFGGVAGLISTSTAPSLAVFRCIQSIYLDMPKKSEL